MNEILSGNAKRTVERSNRDGSTAHANQASMAGGMSAITSGQAPAVDMSAIKARQKATWESGDFGQVAKFTMPAAEEFMARVELWPGARVLDAACGTGNLAVVAAGPGRHRFEGG